MTEQEALARMIPPGMRRPSKPYRGGVIQVHVTRACDKACYGCTQGSNLAGRTTFISPENFTAILDSLKGYWGVVGVFGGNPATHPRFEGLCAILREHFPREQCGLWCNNPLTPEKGAAMRATFDPAVSNLNVHLDTLAYHNFRQWWPEARPFGEHQDSRHSPVYVAMKDVVADEGERWRLISDCDINKHWSAMAGEFRGQPRAWFCEIAGAQSILHQDDPDYPDTGLDPRTVWEVEEHREHLFGGPTARWWQLGMLAFKHQVRKHCHECGVPLRGHGELAMSAEAGAREQVSATHEAIFRPKRKGRAVELVTVRDQLGAPLAKMTDYLGNVGR